MMHSLYGSLCQDPLAAAVALMDPTLASKDTTFTKIFVGGLPYHTTDKTLREYFEQFGDIEEAVVITDRQTGKSRGYGFVTMKDRAGAERACKDPNPIIDGRKANVNLAYLGAKPRNNLQLGLPLPLQASIPALLPSRLGLQQFYYSPSPFLTSPSLVNLQSMSPLSPTAASQYLDYTTAAAAASAAAAYGNNPAAAYEPLAYTSAAYGVLPAGYGSVFGAQGVAGANALAAQTAAYQAAAAANSLQGAADRQ